MNKTKGEKKEKQLIPIFRDTFSLKKEEDKANM